MLRLSSFSLTIFAFLTVSAPLEANAQSRTYYYAADPGYFNGYTVILSAPTHTDTYNRGECGTYSSENRMGFYNAYYAANLPNDTYYIDLASRGYDTYILWYDDRPEGYKEHTRIAKNLPHNYYVTIHSNSNHESITPPNPSPTFCSSRGTRGSGTEVWYNPSNARNAGFPQKLVDKVAPSSPGPNRGIKATSGLHETNQMTGTPMGYLEAEFHDWDAGVSFLNSSTWQWSIASAIEAHRRGW